MIKKYFDIHKADHYARHLALASLVVFLFVLNFTIFDYAAASSGSAVDTKVHHSLQVLEDNYDRSNEYMYDYSVTWGEFLLEWNDFIVDTYYILQE